MNLTFTRPLLTLSLIVLLAPLGAQAQTKATTNEAIAMVKKAVVELKAAGKDKDKLYAAVTAKDPKWVDRDLYLVVYGTDGAVKAHGANGKLVGKPHRSFGH